VTDDETQIELALLEERCRGRERLIEVLSPAVGLHSAGVRVLFTGPSGTGKTLAARLLAAVLGMDLHALQLSTVVDKYLGETEKNLTAVFARAAELDAILLLDEGDALLTRRTEVATSNDRYANLQTNHLLQQLEAHDGIVVITTNAGDRIDSAFQRRIDVVVEFRPPDAGQRWRLWRHHLPADHEVDDDTLAEIASRCQLTGGQIRNAVLHAWLLAMDVSADAVPSTRDVEAAVRREYRKMGTICPLRLD
jgi:SpoVK/Ycf46/Vps4 family AAA+-type ATPase